MTLLEKDLYDALKMLHAIVTDPYANVPANCVKCKDASGQIIKPSKAITYAETAIRHYDDEAKGRSPQEPSRSLRYDQEKLSRKNGSRHSDSETVA